MLGCGHIDGCRYIYRGFPYSLSRPTLAEARGVGVASSPTLSISDAERRVYHNRSVSDAHNPHRTFGTMWMLICPTPIVGSRLAATLPGDSFSFCKVSDLAHYIVYYLDTTISRPRHLGPLLLTYNKDKKGVPNLVHPLYL